MQTTESILSILLENIASRNTDGILLKRKFDIEKIIKRSCETTNKAHYIFNFSSLCSKMVMNGHQWSCPASRFPRETSVLNKGSTSNGFTIIHLFFVNFTPAWVKLQLCLFPKILSR